MRRSGSEEIGSPFPRSDKRAREGFPSDAAKNKRAYISLVNSRAEALGYKTRKIARLLLPGAPNEFSVGILESAYTSKYPIPHPSFVRSPI
jgi:hypothetical protein